MGLGITGMVSGRREVGEESSTGSLSTFVGCSLFKQHDVWLHVRGR